MEAIRRIVLGVVREAMRERALADVVVLRPGSPEHELLTEWLAADGFHEVGIRAAPGDEATSGDDAAGAHRAPAFRSAERAPADRTSVVLDPAPKEVVLLDGPLPGADVVPFGDAWGTRVRLRDADAALSPLESALAEAFEHAGGFGALEAHLPAGEAAAVRRRLLRTAPLLRPPVVPKLTEWTPGIDPGP